MMGDVDDNDDDIDYDTSEQCWSERNDSFAFGVGIAFGVV